EHFLGQVRRAPISRPTKCTDCHIRALCSTCAATSELEHGDAEAPVEVFCEVAHLRAHVAGVVPPTHGDCAFCQGRAGYEGLMRPVAAVQSAGDRPAMRRPSLKVLGDAPAGGEASCGSGGCGSCSATDEAEPAEAEHRGTP